jgi:glyoxylase-like metal-dependent hydrolase (beta-lactamase superfamily II)
MIEEPAPLPPITPGVARALSPLVRRIASSGQNGQPGLNTYLVGIDEIVIIDPGPLDPGHLEVLCGCGGDRIRWIVLTDTDERYSAGAMTLKERTGAELVAPAGFDGADEMLGDGYKIDATEFRITAVAINDGSDGRYSFVLEQERTLLTGDHCTGGVPAQLPEKVKSYRIKAIAPGHGQYIEDAKTVLTL